MSAANKAQSSVFLGAMAAQLYNTMAQQVCHAAVPPPPRFGVGVHRCCCCCCLANQRATLARTSLRCSNCSRREKPKKIPVIGTHTKGIPPSWATLDCSAHRAGKPKPSSDKWKLRNKGHRGIHSSGTRLVSNRFKLPVVRGKQIQGPSTAAGAQSQALRLHA
jgi:hypothetical protein